MSGRRCKTDSDRREKTMTAIKQRGEGSPEDSVKILRERIAKGGKILNLVCRIIRVILVLNIAGKG